MQTQGLISGSDFRGLSPRPPSTSKSWENAPQGLTPNVKNTLGVSATLSATSVSSYGALQPSSSEGVSDESNPMILSSSTERSPPPFAKRYDIQYSHIYIYTYVYKYLNGKASIKNNNNSFL